MEQVLYRLHVKILTTTNHFVSYELRRLLEYSCLFLAIGSLLTLFLLHSTYIINASSPKFNCLLNAIESFEHFSLLENNDTSGFKSSKSVNQLRIENILQNYRNRSSSPFDIYSVKLLPRDLPFPAAASSSSNPHETSASEKSSFVGGSHRERPDDLFSAVFDEMYEKSRRLHPDGACDLFKNPNSDEHQYPSHCYQYPRESTPSILSGVTLTRSPKVPSTSVPTANSALGTPLASNISIINVTIHREDYLEIRSIAITASEFMNRLPDYTYLFAFDRSILLLSQEIYYSNPSYVFNLLEVEIHRSSRCFGPKITNRFVDLSKALDVVIMNWVIAAFDGQGFLYNVITRELLNLNYARQLIAKKGIQLHEMARRESYYKSHSNNYLNMYLDFMKQFMLWHQKTIFSPIVALITDYLDGLVEIIIESIGSTTLFQLFLKQLDAFSSSRDFSFSLSSKLVTVTHQYLIFRFGVACSTIFLFFITSTLISYILRETQERMVRFTFLLQYHVTRDLPITSLLFTHVTESLVFVPIMMGIYFFLFEFFSDQLLAFLVLLVVWIAEVFSILSLRSKVSIKYFPRMFFYYFALFHIYFFSYPFGFTYLALFTAFIFVFHSITHFWNVYEVPAVDSGLISPAHPRIGRPIDQNNTNERTGASSGPSVVNSPERPNSGSLRVSSSASLEGSNQVSLSSSPPRSSESTAAAQFSMSSEAIGSSNNFTNILGRAVNTIFARKSNENSPSRNRSSSADAAVESSVASTFNGHPAAAGPPRPPSRFVIQLPNVDVSRNQFSIPAPQLGPVRRKKSGTEEISPPLPSLQVPSSASQSASSSSNSTPRPSLTQSALSSNASLGDRTRSGSNVSAGSSGSIPTANNLWCPNVYESIEVRRMRLEREKLRYNINQPPPPHHPAFHSHYQSNNSSAPNSPQLNSTGASTSQKINQLTENLQNSQNSGSQLSMFTASSGNPSETNTPIILSNNDHGKQALEFPQFEEAHEPSASDREQFVAGRNIVSTDDLIGFFMEEEEEKEKESGSVPSPAQRLPDPFPAAAPNVANEEKVGLLKNYSFNVFGNVFEEE